MDAIVAVYADWGIGAAGTQPVTLHADRRRFRQTTDGAAVIVGRKTLEDFPGGRPLRGRHNIVLTRQPLELEDAEVVHSPEAAAAAAGQERCFVIGGASVYRQLLPYVRRAFVTQIDLTPQSDSFFPKLDEDPAWRLAEAEPWQEEDGVRYRFCVYERA